MVWFCIIINHWILGYLLVSSVYESSSLMFGLNSTIAMHKFWAPILAKLKGWSKGDSSDSLKDIGIDQALVVKTTEVLRVLPKHIKHPLNKTETTMTPWFKKENLGECLRFSPTATLSKWSMKPGCWSQALSWYSQKNIMPWYKNLESHTRDSKVQVTSISKFLYHFTFRGQS